MRTFTKHAIRAGIIAAGLITAAAPAAFAGEWRLDARACPDLREDHRDARRDHGRADRREDRRDQRVINCPARAWVYQPDRYEVRNRLAPPPRPREVIAYRDGRHFYRDNRGAMVSIRLGL